MKKLLVDAVFRCISGCSFRYPVLDYDSFREREDSRMSTVAFDILITCLKSKRYLLFRDEDVLLQLLAKIVFFPLVSFKGVFLCFI